MSDLVKKIKIKKQDGTFTDYIPIGAEAQNIETNDGESVEVKLNKKPYYYNTVADMKADTKLKVGDMAITLGYYEPNDGGASKYKIVNSSDKYYEILNNNLKAELIYDNEINIKAIGAYGDNTHDDLNKFLLAISLLDEKGGIINIPQGHYIISDTLEFEDKISFYGINGIPVLIYSGSSSFFDVKGHLIGQEYTEGSENFLSENKNIFSNLHLTTLTNEYYGEDNTIAINFLSNSNRTIARSFIENVSISHFDIGINFGKNNFYIMNFLKMHILRNNKAIQISGPDYSNSGERITFRDCILDSNKKVFYFYELIYNIDLISCSIDYNTTCFDFFSTNDSIGGGKVTINNCHYETNSNSTAIDEAGHHGIIWGNSKNTNFFFINNNFFINPVEYQFISNNQPGSIQLFFFYNTFNYTFPSNQYGKLDLNRVFVSPNFSVVAENNTITGMSWKIPFSKYQFKNPVPGFTYTTTSGTCTYESNTGILKDNAGKDTLWNIFSLTNSNQIEISSNTDTKTGYKPLIFVNSSDSNSITFNLQESLFTEIKRDNIMYQGIVCKNVKKVQSIIRYYDINHQLVTETQPYTCFENNSLIDTDLISLTGQAFNVPLSRPTDKYVKIYYIITGIEGKNVEIQSIFIHTI